MISVLGNFCQATYFSPPDTPNTNTKDIIFYNKKKEINDGESSRITTVRCSQNKNTYVVKWPKDQRFYDQIRQESKILQYLNAQSLEDSEGKNYIITLIALFSLKEEPILLFPFYGNKDLLSLIIQNEALSLDQTLFFGKQLMKALIFLKQHSVIHRDIKPENIVITNERILKLIDFGFATRTDEPFLSNLCGTLKYLSPDLLKNPTPNLPSDMWAAAYTIYIMSSGLPIFHAENIHTLKKEQQLFLSNPSPFKTIKLPSSLNMNQFTRALNQMMDPDPTTRSSPERGLHLLSEIEPSPSDLEADLVDREAVANAIENQITIPSNKEDPCCVIQ